MATRVLGRPRFSFLILARQRSTVVAVFDKLGPTYVRFLGATPKVGDSYECGHLIEKTDRPAIRARVLREVALDSVQQMLKKSGSRRKVKGQWFEVISD